MGQGPLRAPDHVPGFLRAGCSTPYVRTVYEGGANFLAWCLCAGVRNITYDITELYSFIDQLGDLCCLVHNGYGAYEPHNKQWVKDRVFAHLKRMAQ